MRISRRDFIKIASLTAAAATVPLGELVIEGREESSVLERLQAPVSARVREARTACFICGQVCPIKVYVEEKAGREYVKKIEFNYAEGSEEEYAACGRPQVLFEARFLQQRIRKPLKRVGERGSGQFEEISWEEALDIIASKLREYSPDEIVVFAHQGCESGLMTSFFKNVVSVPNVTAHCDTCHTGLDYAGWWLFGEIQGPSAYRPDYLNARLVVFMGRNPVEGIVSSPWTKLFAEGRRRGLRIIAFDVRKSRLTQLADRYFIIPPGTDLAISLAMLHTIIKEKLYDEEYLRAYTNAPMLVYTDTLEPVGLEDHPQWNGKKTYMVLDEVDGKVKLKTDAEKPALRATVEVNGRKAVTALDLIWEAVKDYTPEWAEGITGVKADDIRWVARQLAGNAPRAFIDPGYRGTRYRNEGMMFRVNFLINVLLGAVGSKGGIAWPRKVELKDPFSLLGIKGQGPRGDPLYKYWEEQGVTFINHKCFSQLAIKSILEEKPRKIRMVFIFNENIVSHIQGSSAVIEALKKVDFVVVADSTFNETVLYADLVLPLTMFFEQSASSLFSPSKTGTGQVTVIEKALNPPEGVDAKPGWWIVKELGKRIDPANADKYEALSNHNELWKKQAEALGIDYESLMSRGVATVYSSPIYHPLKGKYLPTATGEIEVVNVNGLTAYKDHAWKESHYNPFPVWMPPLWMKKSGGKLGDNEFVAVDVCHRMTATNMWIRFTRLSQDSLSWDRMDGVVINRERAEKLGVRDGELVRLVGPGGSLLVRVRVSDRVHPLVALAPHATNTGYVPGEVTVKYRDGRVEKIKLFPEGRGLGINTSMLASFSDMILEEGGRAAQCDVVVRIEKVGGGA